MWLPCQAAGFTGSVLGLVGPVLRRVGEIAVLISSFYRSVAARRLVCSDPCPRHISSVPGTLGNRETKACQVALDDKCENGFVYVSCGESEKVWCVCVRVCASMETGLIFGQCVPREHDGGLSSLPRSPPPPFLSLSLFSHSLTHSLTHARTREK